jgi:hypothetical protein
VLGPSARAQCSVFFNTHKEYIGVRGNLLA